MSSFDDEGATGENESGSQKEEKARIIRPSHRLVEKVLRQNRTGTSSGQRSQRRMESRIDEEVGNGGQGEARRKGDVAEATAVAALETDSSEGDTNNRDRRWEAKLARLPLGATDISRGRGRDSRDRRCDVELAGQEAKPLGAMQYRNNINAPASSGTEASGPERVEHEGDLVSRPGAYVVEGIRGGAEPSGQQLQSPLDSFGASDKTHYSAVAELVDLEGGACDRRNTAEIEEYCEEEVKRRFEEKLQAAQIVLAEREERGLWYWACRHRCLSPLLVAVVLVSAVLGAVFGTRAKMEPSAPDESSAFTPPDELSASMPRPTLESVREAGVLRCGRCIGGNYFCDFMGVDLCRAVGAAVFGNSSQVEIVPLQFAQGERFIALANGSVDLDAGYVTHTMERHVYHPEAGQGFSFTTPYLFSGMGFGGIPPFVTCADNLSTAGECKQLKICAPDGTTYYDIVSGLFQASRVFKVPFDGYPSALLRDGICNVIAGDPTDISPSMIRDGGYLGEYAVGSRVFSKEPLAIVTRNDDPGWSDFVNWVVQALMKAEEQNFTRATARTLTATTAYDHDDYTSVFTAVIAAVGNYGELYRRHMQDIEPRRGMNMLNDKSNLSGLIYSHTLGNVLTIGAGPIEGGNMEKVINSGSLRCGIRQLAGFGEFDAVGQTWNGLDADYCRAVAAGLFKGDSDALEFVNITGPRGFHEMLVHGDIDLMSGGSVSLENEVGGPTSGEGMSYSQPYFFPPSTPGKNSTLGNAFALVTLDEDAQFSAFVYWIVASTFYAEENGIAKMDPLSYKDMPAINLFGQHFVFMLRDTIIAVGNYAELYARNLELLFPRGGGNLLGASLFPLPGV